jgi:hypothetical protein
MALIRLKKNGTCATTCSICKKRLTDPIFATSHFISDKRHPLWRFSDAPMHWACYANWKHQKEFANLYFKALIKVYERNPYSSAIFKSDDLMVTCSTGGVLIFFAKTGTIKGVERQNWNNWLKSEWKHSCVHKLEEKALLEILETLKKIELPDALDQNLRVNEGEPLQYENWDIVINKVMNKRKTAKHLMKLEICYVVPVKEDETVWKTYHFYTYRQIKRKLRSLPVRFNLGNVDVNDYYREVLESFKEQNDFEYQLFENKGFEDIINKAIDFRRLELRK